MTNTGTLLGPAEIRALAADLGLRPTKTLGQNFLHDPNTIRRIVRTAELVDGERVLEIGPGLGSLTLGLLEAGHPVTAVEIDPVLAKRLPATVAERLAASAPVAESALAAEALPATVAERLAASAPVAESALTTEALPATVAEGGLAPLAVVTADALRVTSLPGPPPTALVANLPYNVAVPVVLHLLEAVPSLQRGLVMVQAEVADRLAAAPGSKVYGVPSVKVAWYATATRAGAVPRTVFWPVPNVDSGLVRLVRRDPPAVADGVTRADVFRVIDAAFAQRRKTLRAALSGWAGGAVEAEAALRAAGVDPSMRGERLDVEAFTRIAARHPSSS